MGARTALLGALIAVGGCINPPTTTQCSDGVIGPNADLHVVDGASGAPLTFLVSVDGAAPDLAECVGAATDGGTAPTEPPCFGEIWFRLIGSHTVVISSAGYASTTLTLDGGLQHYTCGGDAPTKQLALTVSLNR